MLWPLNSYLLSKLDAEQRRRSRRIRRRAWLVTLRRMRSLSECRRSEDGTPIDRYYVERFLADNRDAISGKVLEIGESRYSARFGSALRSVDVLDIDGSNPQATIVADLAAADAVADNTFDCIIATQTLRYIFEHRAAIRHLHRILRSPGTLLATVPAVSKMDAQRPDTDLWRYTPSSVRALFAEAFGVEQVSVASCGNLVSAIAFLAGMTAEELRAHELDRQDPDFPLIVAARCVKPQPHQP